MQRRQFVQLGIGAATALLPVPALAQAFPSKPITLIMPWPAGSGVDLWHRAMAEAAGKLLGQPVIVDNKTGGSGTSGPAAMAASARPDGYTIAQMPVTSHFAIPVLLALTVWFIYMFVGIHKHGFFGFFKLMCYIPGIPAAMHLLLIPIEFLSNIILRPFTLAIRLFANMFAGHMLITIAAVGTLYLWGEGGVLNYILGVLPFVGSLGLVFFELLICSLQAYVFVLLTAIYLESSLADSH